MSHTAETLVERDIRCLLFDLGDTLWYRDEQEKWEKLENVSNRRAAELLRQHNAAALLPPGDDQALGQRLRQAFDEQVRAMIRRAPLQEPDAGQAVCAALNIWGIDGIRHELGRALFEALRVRIPHSRPLFSDSLPTLAELRRRGFLLGVVTNRLWGGPPFHEDLATLGLLDYFELPHIAISGDLGVRKPNPRIFEHVLQSLQVAPREAAMIGDSLSADILGAQSLGIMAIWKPKPWLREWALAHVAAEPVHAENPPHRPSLDTFPGIDTADAQIEERSKTTGDASKGMYVTDDDYILARVDNGRDYLEQFRRGEIRPDHVIGQVAELLEIFPQAGQS